MKHIKLLLLLVFVLTGLSVRGESFFEKGKYWIYKDYRPGPDGEDIEPTYHKVSVVGDTVVNNESAVRLCSETISPKSDRKTYYAAKEENGRISVSHYPEGTFVPVVDFSLHVGDLTEHDMEIMNEGTCNINGVERRIISASHVYCKKIHHWIEGVGATGDVGFITPFAKRLGFQQDILECYVGDRQIYSEDSLDEYSSQEPAPYFYDKMMQVGRNWILSLYYWDHAVGHERWRYRRFVVVEEEVMVAGVPCKKIIETSLDPTAEDYDNPSYCMYACEHGGRLYYMDGEEWGSVNSLLNSGREDLIKKWTVIDFNVNVGDEVSGVNYPGGYKDYKVVDKDHITVNGKNRIRITLEDDSGNQTYWVEGIGSMDLFYQSFPLVPVCGAPANPARKYQEGVDFFDHLAECRQFGEIIFQMENFFNPDAPFVDFDYAAVREIPVTAPSLESGVVYDLQGRAVTNPQRGSIYIQNGRKIVWK